VEAELRSNTPVKCSGNTSFIQPSIAIAALDRAHVAYNSSPSLWWFSDHLTFSATAMQLTKLLFSLALIAVTVTATTIPIHGSRNLQSIEARCGCHPGPGGIVCSCGVGCPCVGEVPVNILSLWDICCY
jgi:hypothetical protein